VAYTTKGQDKYGIYPKDLHYFYEVSVPLSSFGTDWGKKAFDLHWTQNCATTASMVDPGPTPPPSSVPKPGTLALLPLGMIGIAALRRKKPAA